MSYRSRLCWEGMTEGDSCEAESGKHKFYREESGKEIRVQEIPWK